MYIGTVKRMYTIFGNQYYVFCTNDALASVYLGDEKKLPEFHPGRYILDISDIKKLPENDYPKNSTYKLEDISKLHYLPKDTIVFSPKTKQECSKKISSLVYHILRNNLETLFVFYIDKNIKEKALEKTLGLKGTKSVFCKTIKELHEITKDCKEILAFANDEKDALIYSEMHFDTVFLVDEDQIPNAALFWDNPTIISRIMFFSKENFRYKMLYAYYPLEKILHNSHSDEKLTGFHEDNLIVYHSRYYKQKPKNLLSGRMCGETLDYDFYNDKKGYVEKNLQTLINQDFAYVFPNSNTFFLKVPGHNPKITEDAMSVLLDGFSEKFGKEHVIKDCLVRTKEVSSAKKTNERTINKHFDSLDINEKYKDCLEDKVVYLFDDVCTTGSSLFVSSEILYKHKVRRVVCFSIACTGNEGFDGAFLPIATKTRELKEGVYEQTE